MGIADDVLDKLLPPKGAAPNPQKSIADPGRPERAGFFANPFEWLKQKQFPKTLKRDQWCRLLSMSRSKIRKHLAAPGNLKDVQTRLDEYEMEYDWEAPDYSGFPPKLPAPVSAGGVMTTAFAMMAAGGQAWGDPAPEVVTIAPMIVSAGAVPGGGIVLWVMGEGILPPLRLVTTNNVDAHVPDETGTNHDIEGATIRLIRYAPASPVAQYDFPSEIGQCKGYRSIRISTTLTGALLPGQYEVQVINDAMHKVIGGPTLEITP